MKTKIHNNYILVLDTKIKGWTRAEFIGIMGCKACQKRCKACHYPFSVSTAIDENNYCSSRCEEVFISRLIDI